MHSENIRAGRPEDATGLAEFARHAFDQAFGALNDPAQLQAYLATSFGLQQQTHELRDPAWSTRLVERDGELIAYAQLRTGDTPACIAGTAPLELVRFYLDASWHGKGIADVLMDDVMDTARARGARTIWLGVWQVNARAIAFYKRRGFRVVGQKTFQIAADAQTDWVMALPLGPDG